MVKHMCRIRTIFIYRRYESRREVCCNILDINILFPDSFPKAILGIRSFTVPNIYDTAAFQINYNCFAYMTFTDSKIVYAGTLHTFQRRMGIMMFKMASV